MSGSFHTELHLLIKNKEDEMSRMNNWLANTCEDLDIASSISYKMDLCANEAIKNIIDYGFRDEVEHKIVLTIKHDRKDETMLEIIDEGVPFNPVEYTPHPLSKDLAEAPIGGHGIRLMKVNADKIAYNRESGKNVLKMYFS